MEQYVEKLNTKSMGSNIFPDDPCVGDVFPTSASPSQIMLQSNCGAGGGGCGYIEGRQTDHYLVWFDVETNNHTGAIVSVTYLYTEYVGTTTEYIYSCSSGGGNSGNNNPNAESFVPQVPEGIDLEEFLELIGELDEQIFIDALEGKEKCAYKALVDANGNLFNETIGTFGVEGSRYDLTFIYGECERGEACTDASDINNGNLTIKIDDRGLDVLEYAALLLHEGIHAEIYRYVHENGGNIDPNERINLYDKYKQYKIENGSLEDTEHAHHQHMADRFVYPIARAIRELDGFRYPVEQYLGFGWDGLRSYGFDGYYDDNLNFHQFEHIDYHSETEEVLNTTTVGNNCDE